LAVPSWGLWWGTDRQRLWPHGRLHSRQYRRVDDRQQHGIADGGGPKWTITVRFSDGIDRDIRSKTPPEVRPGDKVSVDNGEIRRH
jgi:hypothetical protein